MDNKRGFVITIIAVVILAAGAGYYLWHKQGATNAPGGSSLDTFFGKLGISGRLGQAGLKEYKDDKGIFSITYPASWTVRADQGRRLTGVNITPQELLDQYPPEEQGFVKGLIASADESNKSPEEYFRDLVGGGETGETEVKNTTINGYPAFMVKGNVNGVFYVIYIVSHNGHVVYFNYRAKEEESARRRDIKKAINFEPYTADFEAAVHSIKLLK